MDTNILMPKLGLTMEFGTVSQIFVKVGDRVSKGDPILEFETEKLTSNVEAPADGVITAISCSVDDDVPTGQPVGTMRAD